MVGWVFLFANLWGIHGIQRPGLQSTSLVLALQVHWSRSILNSEKGWILKSTQNDKTLKTEWKAGKDCTIHELAPSSSTMPSSVRTTHPQCAVLGNRLTVRRKQKGKLQEVVHLTCSSLLFLLFSKAPIKCSQGDGAFQYRQAVYSPHSKLEKT